MLNLINQYQNIILFHYLNFIFKFILNHIFILNPLKIQIKIMHFNLIVELYFH